MKSDKLDPQVLKCLNRLQALCSRSEQCPSDLMRKMAKADLPYEQQLQVMALLEEEGFVNVDRYAGAFVRDKSRLQGWGPQKIAYALRMKEIQKEVIESALAQIDEDLNHDHLKTLMVQKRRSLKELDKNTLKIKLFRFAMHRGFLYEQIAKVWHEMEK